MTKKHLSPITIYIVHHPDCESSEDLARSLFSWFRLGENGGHTAVSAGLPVFFRRRLTNTAACSEFYPTLELNEAHWNVIVLLVDQNMLIHPEWRSAAVNLAERLKTHEGNSTLLPVALHQGLYRIKELYQFFNPIPLIELENTERQAELRRAVTIAASRALIDTEGEAISHNVFLSHAKRDGTQIAECIRDSIRQYGQLTAWYDANDLRHGEEWEDDMQTAAKEGVKGMIAVASDCLLYTSPSPRDATLSRMPSSA